MKIEKNNIEDILQLDIGEISKDKLCSEYELRDENNRGEFLCILMEYFSSFGECLYSEDSEWVEFFRSKIVERFGESNDLVIIDKEYWLLFLGAIEEGVKFFDLYSIDADNLERARKLVKLFDVIEEIGRENDQKDSCKSLKETNVSI